VQGLIVPGKIRRKLQPAISVLPEHWTLSRKAASDASLVSMEKTPANSAIFSWSEH
jgi:hypothetical protein